MQGTSTTVKITADGGGTVEVTRRPAGEGEPAVVVMTAADNGGDSVALELDEGSAQAVVDAVRAALGARTRTPRGPRAVKPAAAGRSAGKAGEK